MSMPTSKANGNTEIPGPAPGEPCENDPCIGMENNTSAPLSSDDEQKSRNVFVKFRDQVCERWNLPRRVFYFGLGLLAALLVLLIVVIALGAAWPRLRHSQIYPVCKRAECLRGAAQIRESMNSTVSPCSDLWTWACGGWLTKYPLPRDKSIWNQKEQLVRQEASKTKDLITTLDLPLNVSSAEWKLKHFYESCLNIDNVNTDEARPLTSIISELGGWYILRDWTNADFDPAEVLKQLQVKYGVSPFFKITVEADPRTPGLNSIRISPSGLGLPDRDYYYRDQDDRIQVAYKELIRDIVKYLSSTRSEAEKFGTDMFFYEKRIAEITPGSHLLQNPVMTCNHIKVSELKDTIHNVPFYDILTAMYSEAKINETTEVIVSSLEYLTEVSRIIATTDRRTMNGYLIWTLVRHYVPYLSEKFTSAVDNFKAELFGIREPAKRWEVCATLVRKFMGLAVNSLTEKMSPVSIETEKVVNETFHSILEVTLNRLDKFKSMPQLYKLLQEKLKSVQFQIGLPPRISNSTYIKNYYNKMQVIKSNFFESVRYAFEFRRKLEGIRLTGPSSDHTIISHLTRVHPQVTYAASENSVIIPQNLLNSPYFESSYPKSIIYGRLGTEIAQAIVDSVLPYGSFWAGNRKLLSQYHKTVNDSLILVDPARDCIYKFLLNLNLDVPYDIANETGLLTLRTLSAISIAHEALESVLKDKEHIHQAGLEEFEDSTLYFLTFAQTQCSESTNQYQLYDNIVNFRLSQRTLLHVMWAQLPEFSQSLDCSFNKKTQCLKVF